MAVVAAAGGGAARHGSWAKIVAVGGRSVK